VVDILNHLSFCGGSSRKNHTGETNIRIVPTPSKLFYDKEETGYSNLPWIRKNSTRNLLLKTGKIRSYSEQGCGSLSAWIRIHLAVLDPFGCPGSGSGSRSMKIN
jgi:hypothetical protein